MPSGPVTPLLTRLATLGLVAAAAAVVVTATAHSTGSVRARVAADTSPAFVVPNDQPTVVQLVGAQRVGDAILLRVDPVGSAGQRSLIVSPGAHVTGMTLQALLAASAERGNAVHRTRYRLTYDDNGAIVGLAPTR